MQRNANFSFKKSLRKRKHSFILKFLNCSDTAEPNENRFCTDFVNASLIHAAQKAVSELHESLVLKMKK